MEGLQGAQAEAETKAEAEAETKPASTPPTKLSRLGALPTDALRLALSFLDVRGLARLDSAWTCAREREHHWLAALRAGSGAVWVDQVATVEEAELEGLLLDLTIPTAAQVVGGLVRAQRVAVWLELRGVSMRGAPLPVVCEASTLAAVEFIRRKSMSKSPLRQEIIDTGCLPLLVELLAPLSCTKMQLEVAWVLTNIAAGSSEQTQSVVDAGAVPPLVQLLPSPNDQVREQAAWALANVAGDCARLRDVVFSHGALPAMLELLQTPLPQTRIETIRQGTRALRNLCRGQPAPALAVVSSALPVLRHLIDSADAETVTEACWALSDISDGPNERIEAVLQAGVAPRLVELMHQQGSDAQVPALRTAGNIVAGTDQQTQHMINVGVIPALRQVLDSPKQAVRNDACWAISNITAGTPSQVQAVIDADIVPKLVHIVHTDEDNVKKNAAWAISNAACHDNPYFSCQYLFDQGAVPALCVVLNSDDANFLKASLEGLKSMLENLSGPGRDSAVAQIRDSEALIERLQQHEVWKISQLAKALLNAIA